MAQLTVYKAAANTAIAAPTKLPAEARGAATLELVVEAAEEVVCCAAEVAVVREAELVVAGPEVEDSAAVVDDSEESVVDESEDPVVAVEEEDSLAVVDSWEASVELLDDFSLQTTESGVETPAEEQICLA